MSYPTIYAAITNHGFGHATRTAALMREVKRLQPEIRVIFATKAPAWLLQSYLRSEDFVRHPVTLDVGVVQGDSLTMDKAATLEALQQLQDQEAAIVATEADFVRQQGVNLILSDVPPLANSIARAAGVPCWTVSNFGWDFIYRPWGGRFVEVADWMATRYQWSDRTFRLPFHDTMDAFPNPIDVGLTGGTPCYLPGELREKFQITAPPERTVLITFGGMGVNQIPYDNLQRFPDWQFITFDATVPDLPNLVKTTNPPFRPVDFMQLCDFIICKPGYGTFAEACRMGIGVIAIDREDFAETQIMFREIRKYNRHRILSPAEFLQGDWSFLREPLHPPENTISLRQDGNEVIAAAIVEQLSKVAR